MSDARTVRQHADDEADTLLLLAALESEYVEACAHFDQLVQEQRHHQGLLNAARNTVESTGRAYREAFRAVHGCDMPGVER